MLSNQIDAIVYCLGRTDMMTCFVSVNKPSTSNDGEVSATSRRKA